MNARRLICLERFLARLVSIRPSVLLKGGLALKLRMPHARATKDVDLNYPELEPSVLDDLQHAGRMDMGDFLEYRVERRRELLLPGMAQAGARFRAECLLGGKKFADPFAIDVAVGEPIFAPPEHVRGSSWLDFAEIAVPTICVQAIEAQVAEKLHAYTRPRPLENTRVRDLPDLALLASLRPIEAGPLMLAVTSTFSARNTHPVPDRFPSPPSTAWARPYASLANEHDLQWKTLEEVTLAVRAFLDPVLAGKAPLTWSPVDWLWLAA